MNLSESSKNISEKCISIPVLFNSGRKGYIVTSNAGTYINVDGSNFIDLDDGYLHIDEEKLSSNYTLFASHFQTSLEEVKTAISKMNTLYFAGLLKINSNLFTLEYANIIKGFKSFKNIFKDMIVYKIKNEIFDFLHNKKKHFWIYRIDFKKFSIFKRETVEIKKKLDCPKFGGSWQDYYSEDEKHTWLKEAEKLKGSKIYLA